jgi:uncharacterized membrane protein YdjX (TVP38/TMEM64 family)
MKSISKFLVVAIWAALIYTLYRLDLLTGNIDNLNQFFDESGSYKTLIFVALSSLRIVALIPSAVFMVLGGIIFNPFESILLTLISIIISETMVYVASKVLVSSQIQSYLINKYPKLYELLLRNNTRILSLGILCPIAPSDVACFLASSTGISYRKFMTTVVFSSMPMIILYSFLGNNVVSSANNTIIIAGIIILISLYSIYLWNRAQRQRRLA